MIYDIQTSENVEMICSKRMQISHMDSNRIPTSQFSIVSDTFPVLSTKSHSFA